MAGKSPDLAMKNFSNLKAVVISASWHPEICQSLIDGAVRGFENQASLTLKFAKFLVHSNFPLRRNLL